MSEFNYDFETVEEKRDYIKSMVESEIVDDEIVEEFTCPRCSRVYPTEDEALTCCYLDCREQAVEYAQERNEYEKSEV